MCVYAKQPMQAQVETAHNLSILYDIYGLTPYAWCVGEFAHFYVA
jgi:hypothetical protein